MRIGRRERPPVELAAGERAARLGARSTAAGGSSAPATRSTSPPDGVPWEQVEAADWDDDHERLRVTEVGTWGEQRPQHLLTLDHHRRRHPPAPPAGARAGDGQRAAGRGTSRSSAASGRPGGRTTRAGRHARRCSGSTSTTPASTPTTPSSGPPPRPPSTRPAPTSGSTDRRSRRRSARFAARRGPLLTCAGSERSPVAQLAEHSAVNRRVVGSSPTGGATHRVGPATARSRVSGPLGAPARARWRRMADYPRLVHTAIDTTDPRGLAEFHRQRLGLRTTGPATSHRATAAPMTLTGWCSSTPTSSGWWRSRGSSASSAPPGRATTYRCSCTWTSACRAPTSSSATGRAPRTCAEIRAGPDRRGRTSLSTCSPTPHRPSVLPRSSDRPSLGPEGWLTSGPERSRPRRGMTPTCRSWPTASRLSMERAGPRRGAGWR